MPDRIIRESVCTSDTIDKLSWFEEVFWHRLTVNCDDYGRFDARPAILKSRLFPLKEGLTEAAINKALSSLATVGLVHVYMYDEKPYLQLLTWAKYQRIRAAKSKYPSPDETDLLSFVNICQQVPSNVPVSESVSESDNSKRKRFLPPTVDEIQKYCKERGNGIDAEHFHDFYQSKNWMVGKTKMVDWKASVRTWEKKDQNRAQPKKELKLLD